MKIFEKRKKGNHCRLYFCGIKVCQYHTSALDFDFNFLLKVLYDTYNEANYAHKLSKTVKDMSDKILRNMSSQSFCDNKSQLSNQTVYIKDEATGLGLWDEAYYIKNYPNIQYYNMAPWDHYVKYGWKMGLNPSAIFDGNWYLKMYPVNTNPLVHYLSYGRFHCHYGFSKNPYPVKPSMLQDYLNNKPDRQSKKVVYTALVGDYDELIIHSYLNPDWDYVCFTDNQEYIKQKQIGPWEIRAINENLELDSTRKNRYYKINPHVVLPEYDESIYVDSNINILTPFIFDYVQTAGKDMVVPRHFSCNCVYEHFKWAYRDYVFRPNADSKNKLDGLYALMKSDGFPANYGFTENNLLYRKHNLYTIQNMMEDWWYLIKWYVARDQLSFCYVLWKHGILPQDLHIDNLRSDNANFAFIMHKLAKEIDDGEK